MHSHTPSFIFKPHLFECLDFYVNRELEENLVQQNLVQSFKWTHLHDIRHAFFYFWTPPFRVYEFSCKSCIRGLIMMSCFCCIRGFNKILFSALCGHALMTSDTPSFTFKTHPPERTDFHVNRELEGNIASKELQSWFYMLPGHTCIYLILRLNLWLTDLTEIWKLLCNQEEASFSDWVN